MCKDSPNLASLSQVKAGAPSAGPATPCVAVWQPTEQHQIMLWMACLALFPLKGNGQKT